MNPSRIIAVICWLLFHVITFGTFYAGNSGGIFFAKIKLGMMMAEARGKLNGSVFSRNRGGAYIRNKVTPLNPKSSAQQAARALLISFAQGWRGLTEAQRTAWNAAVENFARTDIFGDLRNPSGEQLYIRLNINISLAGGAAITSPPAVVGAEAVGVITLTATAGPTVISIAYTNTPIPADHAMYVEATENVSAGITNLNSRFRFIELAAAAAISPLVATVNYVLKFGDSVAGQKVGVRAKFIRLTTGEVSGTEISTDIVV